jgi:uncharacterized protein VirK/YbjX
MDLEYAAQWRPAPVRWRWRALQDLDCSWQWKARFLAESWLRSEALAPIVNARPGSSLHRYVQQRPDTVGFLVWPYQCASWGARQRLRRLVEHFDVLDEVGEPFPLGIDDKLLLWDLDDYCPGVRIILDQPKWLFREGMLALSLFCGEHRAYSLAFSLYREPRGGIGAFIGGLQGRNTDDALERYKELTKCFHGMRPRDLLLETLRMIAPALRAQRILAVAEDHRYVRHRYFGGGKADHADYDAVWVERGGKRVDASCFELPLPVSLRCLEEVPSKKRAQYRRRNEMLERLRQAGAVLRSGRVLRFEAT